MDIRRIAISTGGGDAPGLNAVIRAAVLAADRNRENVEVVAARVRAAGGRCVATAVDVADEAGVAAMVRMALDSFVEEDANMARRVLREDDAVDALYGELLRMSMQFIRNQPERVEDGMRIASCAKYLERIADHATNIAEMVIYMVSGDDVRHFVSRSSSSS